MLVIYKVLKIQWPIQILLSIVLVLITTLKTLKWQMLTLPWLKELLKPLKANVPRYIHVSSYNADPNSESVFYATKGIAEQVVRDIIPDTTIVRPAPMYGREDSLLNYLGPKVKMWTPNKTLKRFGQYMF